MNILKPLYSLIALVMLAVTLVSCSNDDAVDVSDINKQTVIVFMPWSGTAGSTGLYSFFLQNLDSIESAIKTAKGMSGRAVVFISNSASSSELYEITYSNGAISHTPIKTYSGNIYNTAAGITQILNDIQSNAYALNYSMIIGCHGTGWTYKDDWDNYPYSAKQHSTAWSDGTAAAKSATGTPSAASYPTTRFYGSVEDMSYATDITTLAEGIQSAGMKMQYILFDDCYMANIETAYELKGVTNFLIGSTSEIMAIGMPYQTMWKSLATPTPAYATAVSAFNEFYSSYAYPYGGISVIDCREVESLASIMKEINSRYALLDSERDSLQVLDGFHETIFYDLGDYVDHLCQNTSLLSDFHAKLDDVVKATSATDTLYSYLYYYEQPKYIKVNTYSGVTISDPSINSVALKGMEKTGWWKATH
jgi:hypothetical protein